MPVRWVGKTLLLLITAVASAAWGSEPSRLSVSAVMGEVRNGGSYELSDTPTLAELLHRANGWTSHANGDVRIIRNGRVAIQTHVAAGLRTPLLPGDIVLIPGRQRRAESDTVEICLQNLSDAPIVLRLRPQHAHLETLVKLLKQKSDVINRLRVVGTIARDGRIADGTVLEFDPRSIDRGQLPMLPQPVLLEAKIQPTALSQTKTGPILRRVDDAGDQPRREPKSQVQLLIEAARMDLDAGRLPQAKAKALEAKRAKSQFGVMDDRPDLILAQIDKLLGKPDLSEIEKSADPRVLTTVPPPKLAQAIPLTDSFPGKTAADVVTPPGPVMKVDGMTPLPPTGDKANASMSTGIATDLGGNADLVKLADSANEAPKSDASFDTVTFVIGTFAAFGVLCAAGLLYSMGRRAIGQNKTTQPKPQTKRHRLEQLLRNELDYIEEPMTLPPDLEFFGMPNGGPSLRLDEAPQATATAPPRPHFADRTAAQPKKQQADQPRSVPAGTKLRSDQPEDAPPQPARVANPSILDRVLSQVHREEIR